MSRRITPLSPLALLAALLATSGAARDAQAHRLDVQLFVLPGRNIQVESWFSDGVAAKGAKVEVFGGHEQLITEGQLNEQGIFVFSYRDRDPRTVVISAGAGHRKKVAISASDLDRAALPAPVATDEPSPAPVPLTVRDGPGAIKDVLIGVGFLLAFGAFVLSIRNAQKLRALGRPGEKAR